MNMRTESDLCLSSSTILKQLVNKQSIVIQLVTSERLNNYRHAHRRAAVHRNAAILELVRASDHVVLSYRNVIV